MVTPEYQNQGLPAPTFTLPSNVDFQPHDPVFATSTACYDNQVGRVSHDSPAYESSWSRPTYDCFAGANMTAWTVPNWNVDYSTSGSTRSDSFHYTPPSHPYHTSEQLPTPPQQCRTPDLDLFMLGSYGHCSRINNQQPIGVPNMSGPSSTSSSPFHYTRFAGVP